MSYWNYQKHSDIQYVYNPKYIRKERGRNAVPKPYKKYKGAGIMRINFYGTRISEDGRTILVKEKSVNYGMLSDSMGKVKNAKDTVRMMNELLYMDRLAEEYCYMTAFNISCRVIGIFFISKGTVSASMISSREIYMNALLVGAVMIIICHNHPSGSVQASLTDIETTVRLKKSGELMGVQLADHIIIGSNGYFSFSESGLL